MYSVVTGDGTGGTVLGVGGVGGGIATGDRATLSATATNGLEEDASGAIARAKCAVAGADDEPGRNGEID